MQQISFWRRGDCFVLKTDNIYIFLHQSPSTRCCLLSFRRVDETGPPPPQTVLSRSCSSRFVVYVLRGGSDQNPSVDGRNVSAVVLKQLPQPESQMTSSVRHVRKLIRQQQVRVSVFRVEPAQFSSSGSIADTLGTVLSPLSLLFKTNKTPAV